MTTSTGTRFDAAEAGAVAAVAFDMTAMGALETTAR
jgi:hypothetical protein